MQRVSFFLLLTMLLASCNNSSKPSVSYNSKSETLETRDVVVDSLPWDEVVEGWVLMGNKIICKTPNRDNIYSVYDADSISKLYSFGKEGHGSLEWVAPHLFVQNDSVALVFDNGTKSISIVKNDVISVNNRTPIKDAVNDLKTVNYPIVGYVSLTPDRQELKIVNIENDSIVDRVAFEDKEGKGNSSLFDFAWNVHSNKIVLAHLHSNTFVIYTVDENGRIAQTDYFGEKEKFSEESFYYTDVQCGDDIYLLSQKNIDVENMSGNSEIEVYDYEGKGKYKIVLNFIADKMLLNANNKRLLLTSASDEQLHFVNLKKN